MFAMPHRWRSYILEIQARKFTVLIYTIQLISSLKYEAMPTESYDART